MLSEYHSKGTFKSAAGNGATNTGQAQLTNQVHVPKGKTPENIFSLAGMTQLPFGVGSGWSPVPTTGRRDGGSNHRMQDATLMDWRDSR